MLVLLQDRLGLLQLPEGIAQQVARLQQGFVSWSSVCTSAYALVCQHRGI